MTLPYHQNQPSAEGWSSLELIGLEPNEPEARALADFKDVFGIPDGESVLCAGMGLNVCASTVFGRDNVTHIATSPGAQQALVAHGYRSVPADLRSYRPTAKADLLIAIDSDERPTPASIRRCLRIGGLAVMNNLTEWVDTCESLPQMQLLAALIPSIRDENATWRADRAELSAIRDRMTTPDHELLSHDIIYERMLLRRAHAGDKAAAEELQELEALGYTEADPLATLEYGPYFDGLFVFKHIETTVGPA